MMALLSPLTLLALVVSSVSSARIAGFMALGGSQYINMKHIMEELASRGHQKIKPSDMVPHRIYQVPLKPDYLDDLIRLDFEGSWLQGISWKRKILNILCESALKSIKMLEEVKDFDLLVYDSPMGMCAPLVAELLGIPRVEILMSAPNTPFSFNHMIPMPFSYVPSHLSGFTDTGRKNGFTRVAKLQQMCSKYHICTILRKSKD